MNYIPLDEEDRHALVKRDLADLQIAEVQPPTFFRTSLLETTTVRSSIATIMAPSRAPYVCAKCIRKLQNYSSSNVSRSFATASTPPRKRDVPQPDRTPSSEQLPRWRQALPAMQMPIRLRPVPKQPIWRVNTEQEPLDQMYDDFIGSAGRSATDVEGSRRGRDMLPEEVKVRHHPNRSPRMCMYS